METEFLTASELFEAVADFDAWVRETNNDPQSHFEELMGEIS